MLKKGIAIGTAFTLGVLATTVVFLSQDNKEQNIQQDPVVSHDQNSDVTVKPMRFGSGS